MFGLSRTGALGADTSVLPRGRAALRRASIREQVPAPVPGADPAIRRRPDGSIDTDFHLGQGRAARAQAFHDAGRRLVRRNVLGWILGPLLPLTAALPLIWALPFAPDMREVRFPALDAQGRADAAHVDGQLSMPAGAGPYPAVVLLHGCAGPSEIGWNLARQVRAAGYALLTVKSTGDGPLARSCDEIGWDTYDPLPEARGAVAHLKSVPGVDPEKVAVVGLGEASAAAFAAIGGDDEAVAPAIGMALARAVLPDGTVDRHFVLVAPGTGPAASHAFGGAAAAALSEVGTALRIHLRPDGMPH